MLKALEILKSINRKVCTDSTNGKLDLAIAELEALQNRSCDNCKHHIDTSKLSDEEYLSLIDQCTRCKHYYNDNWDPK